MKKTRKAFPGKFQGGKDQCRISGRKMKIYFLRSRVLTDEHPKAAKGKPAIDLDTRKTYQPEDRIMRISVQPVVSLPVEVRGENYLLPIYFHGFPSLNREKK